MSQSVATDHYSPALRKLTQKKCSGPAAAEDRTQKTTLTHNDTSEEFFGRDSISNDHENMNTTEEVAEIEW